MASAPLDLEELIVEPPATSTRMEDPWEVQEEDQTFPMSIAEVHQEFRKIQLLEIVPHMEQDPSTNTEEESVGVLVEVLVEESVAVWAAPILTVNNINHQAIKRTVRVSKVASALQEVACKVQVYQGAQTSKCPLSPTKWQWVA